MRIYRVILRSGAKMDISARVMRDNATHSENIYFYRDASRRQIAATFRRDEIVGVVIEPMDSGAASRRHETPS